MNLKLKLLISTLLLATSQWSLATPLYAGYINTISNTLQYDGNNFTGTLAPLVNCINLKSALAIQPLPASIDSLLDGLNDGSIEIAMALVADNDRDNIAKATAPILTLPSVLVSRDPFDPEQLSEVMVSTARGSAYAHSLIKANANIQYADNYNGALNQFLNGDVEATVVPKATLSLSPEWFDDSIFVAPFSEDRIVYYVSNRSPQQDKYLTAITHGINNCVVHNKP